MELAIGVIVMRASLMGDNVDHFGQCFFDFPGYEHVVCLLLGGMEGYGQLQVNRVAGGALRRDGGWGVGNRRGRNIHIVLVIHVYKHVQGGKNWNVSP
jgi:hypothetical protein